MTRFAVPWCGSSFNFPGNVPNHFYRFVRSRRLLQVTATYGFPHQNLALCEYRTVGMPVLLLLVSYHTAHIRD
jgi:hypothetical protein